MTRGRMSHAAGVTSRRAAGGRGKALFVAQPRAIKSIAEQVLAPWNRPAGDELYGIQAIADYLELPFLDVRTLLELDRLPTWKTLIAHTTRRTALVAHFLDMERRAVGDGRAAPAPLDVRANGTLGLLKGVPAIGERVGCCLGSVHKWRRNHGLPVFRLGKHWLARSASLDLWLARVGEDTPSERRRVSLIAKRSAAAPPSAVVGAVAIAAVLGVSETQAFKAIYRRTIPAFRVGKGWAADRDALLEIKANMERSARDGERS